MTNKSKSSENAGKFSLQGMRDRRDRRRSRLHHSPIGPEQCDLRSGTSSKTAQEPTGAIRSAATGDYLTDMLSERELILGRIEMLQLELAKERNDLSAIEIVLSRLAPAKEESR